MIKINEGYKNSFEGGGDDFAEEYQSLIEEYKEATRLCLEVAETISKIRNKILLAKDEEEKKGLEMDLKSASELLQGYKDASQELMNKIKKMDGQQ